VLFHSRLRFGDRDGHQMGQMVPVPEAAGAATEVELALDAARPDWRLHWVVNGERHPAIPLREGATRQSLTVALRGDVTFVRAEIWDTSHAPSGEPIEQLAGEQGAGAPPAESAPAGRCIALTNPIWYLAR
jgi:hypothetical protein